METEERLAKKLEQYQELAKTDKNVDVAALAMSVFADAHQQEKKQRGRRRAYWASVLFPPIGLFIAVYYLLSGKPDSKRAALICVVLTLVSLLATWLVLQLLVASIPAEQMNQLQGTNPKDLINGYREILQ